MIACRHCLSRRASRPLGLCFRCYSTPGVRKLYPSQSKYAPRKDDFEGGFELPPEPTAAKPGTPEKIDVLASRVAARVCPWHPEDEKRLATGGEVWGNEETEEDGE